MTLEERAEALANEYADEFLTGEAKEAILAALRAVVEAMVSEYLRRIERALTAEKEANQTLRDERDRLRSALVLCVERLEGLSEDGLTKSEQQALAAGKAALTPAGGGTRHG